MIRSKQLRARRSLLHGCAWFFALQLAVVLFVRNCWPHLGDPDYDHQLDRLSKLNKVRAPARTVVVLGSSHVYYGFSPGAARDQLAKLSPDLARSWTFFNFGRRTSGHLMCLVTLRRLLAAGEKPAALLVEVMPQVATVPHTHVDLWPERGLTARDLEVVARYQPETARKARMEWVWFWEYVHASRVLLTAKLIPQLLPLETRRSYDLVGPDGEARHEFAEVTPDVRRRAWEVSAERFRPHYQAFQFGGWQIGALEELLTVCREANVPVALLLCPEASELRGYYTPTMRSQLDHYFATLTGRFQVPLIDAREWVKDSEFLDLDHLLPAGRDSFSRRLVDELFPAKSKQGCDLPIWRVPALAR